MSFSATISLTSAGADAATFDIYSDVDGYTVPFETGILKASILAGFTSTNVPNGTTACRVIANCGNSVDMPLNDPYIYVYARCDTGDPYYKPGVTSPKAEDSIARCYQNVDQGFLSAMTVAYPGLAYVSTLMSSSCNCV